MSSIISSETTGAANAGKTAEVSPPCFGRQQCGEGVRQVRLTRRPLVRGQIGIPGGHRVLAGRRRLWRRLVQFPDARGEVLVPLLDAAGTRRGAHVGERRVEPIEVVLEGVAGSRRRGRHRRWRQRRVEPVDDAVARLGGCRPDRRRRHRTAAGEQFLDAVDDDLRLERLHQHAVAADLPGTLFVERLERAGEQDHRDVGEPRIVLDERRDLVAVALGHADVGKDDVRAIGDDPLDRLLAVADRRDLDVFVGERELDDALDRHAVVGEKKLVRHGVLYVLHARPDVGRDEVDDLLHRRAGKEDALDADVAQLAGCRRRG